MHDIALNDLKITIAMEIQRRPQFEIIRSLEYVTQSQQLTHALIYGNIGQSKWQWRKMHVGNMALKELSLLALSLPGNNSQTCIEIHLVPPDSHSSLKKFFIQAPPVNIYQWLHTKRIV